MQRNQFREFLLGLTKPLIVTIETETRPKMVKKHSETKEPNPYVDRIVRRSLRNGMLNCNYENAVNNQRGRETPVGEYMEPFNAEALWNGKGEHIEGTKTLVRHKETGIEYLILMPQTKIKVPNESSSSEYIPLIYDDRYFYLENDEGSEREGKGELTRRRPIDKSLILPYLSDSREGSERQEVEKPILWRTIALSNVVGIKYKGELIPITN